MQQNTRINDYLLQVKYAPRQLFVETFPHMFLCTAGLGNGSDTSPFVETKPQNIVTPAEIAAHSSADSQQPLDLDTEQIFALVPPAVQSGRTRISIGRATNNDLVLLNSSVSKLHALILVGRNRLLIRDAGSRNGTRVNGKSLAKDDRVALELGDTLALGAVALIVLDADRLFDLLTACLQRSEQLDLRGAAE